ncbi:MAG TPA: preprotein translocase subunit SecG [Tenuifilaceae bacterium]|nr:preprotein translocase subunit SecG [Tenuifilaceae bacterium]
MYLLISVLIIIACILLILIVLVQNSKGGGLASNFASSNQVMGVRKTADFLEKATWTLAITLLVLSLLASFSIPRNEEVESKSALEEQIQATPDPSAMPTFPTPQPEEEGQEQEEPSQPEE